MNFNSLSYFGILISYKNIQFEFNQLKRHHFLNSILYFSTDFSSDHEAVLCAIDVYGST